MSNKIFKNKPIKNYFLPYSIIFLSISLILSYIEILLPFNVGNIGIKIGLANIVTLVSLQILDTKWTFLINILRVLIIGVLFGNLVRFMLSFSGFLFSFFVMVALLRIFRFSIVTTSIFGGATHNVSQVITLSIITKNTSILLLAPIYAIIGIISGVVVGLLAQILYKKIIILHLNNT